MIYSIALSALVTLVIAAIIPESIAQENIVLKNLSWLAFPIQFCVQWFFRNTIGRYAPPAKVRTPKLTKVNSAGTEALYVEWEVLDNSSWRYVSHDLEISTDQNHWKRVYSGEDTEFLIEELKERTFYYIRLRTRIGGKPSDWVVWPVPVWTLSCRTAAGGTSGPLLLGGEYTWSQDDNEVEVMIPVPEGTRRGDVSVTIKAKSLCVKLKGELMLNGELSKEAVADDCFWVIADAKVITASIVKKDRYTNWASVISGHPPIDLF